MMITLKDIERLTDKTHLARRLGVSQNTVVRWMLGTTEPHHLMLPIVLKELEDALLWQAMGKALCDIELECAEKAYQRAMVSPEKRRTKCP